MGSSPGCGTRSTAADRAAAPGCETRSEETTGREAPDRGEQGRDARPPVFLAPAGELGGDVIVLSGPEGRHGATVRRLTPGERVDVTDGAGNLAECVVTQAGGGMLHLAVRSRRVEPPADPAVVVVQALPKGDRGPLAVELMTEAGVDVIVPWAAQRCVTQWHGERGERALARWRATAREAAKQSRRARFPEVAGLASTPDVIRAVGSAALAVLLDPVAASALSTVPLPSSGDLVVIVGPEGGLSPAETAALAGAGAVAAHLGPTVLRTSTAGLVAASVMLSRAGRW
jgi:16S rRNA (uracil1498-N3)-methyltransferase